MDKKELIKLSELAKLTFTDFEFNNIKIQLQNIIDLIDQLQIIDCTNINPLASVLNFNLRTREDIVENSVLEKELFFNEHNRKNNLKYFIAPKVIE